MSKQSSTSQSPLHLGGVFETTFFVNPKGDSVYRYRATHANGNRADKVILSNDSHIEPGVPCRVKVVHVDQPRKKNRGCYEVEFINRVDFKIDDSFYIEPLLTLKLQALLESGQNILLDGPQGSGKTALSRHVADALGMEYVFFNCSAVYEPSDFVATIQVQAGPAGQAVTVWIPTPIRNALEMAEKEPEKRFLVFLDEFNRCREMARNGLLPALDHVRKIYDPCTGEFLDIPNNIQWIAAVNNGAQFTGTTTVDPAQLDRFAPLLIGYPPADEEVRILARRHPDVNKSLIKRVVSIANAIRGDPSLNLDLSVRATDEVCLLLSHPNFSEFNGDPLPDLLKSSFCGRFLGRWDDPASDAGMVWKRIEGTVKTASPKLPKISSP